MKIYVIRHGETDWNRELRLQGREDVPLNAAGKIQAAVCGDALKGLGIQAVFTSPLSRARLTGEILAGRIGLDPGAVLAMDGLIERAPDLATRVKWFEERDYYCPLPLSKSPGIVQNDGWN